MPSNRNSFALALIIIKNNYSHKKNKKKLYHIRVVSVNFTNSFFIILYLNRANLQGQPMHTRC